MRAIIFAFLLGFAMCSQAQVYKCSDATGKAIFSDQPCDVHGAKGGPIQRERSADEIYQERIQALDATERKSQRRAAERDQQAFDQQIDASRQRLAIEARSAPQRLNDTTECKKAQKELEFVSSITTTTQDQKRMRINAAITNVNAACGSSTPLMQEPQKRYIRGMPTITGCNARSCQDADHNVYDKDPRRPDRMFTQDGRTCNLVQSVWQCN